MADEEQKRIFAKNLNKYLSLFNKTQKEVADAIEVSPQTFNTWCQGIALPRMGKVQRLADYFGIGKTDLIDEKFPNTFTAKDERDITKDLDRIMAEIRKGDDGPLYYNGIEIDNASINLLQNAIEFALRETKKENKVKYNPNKNKSR
ncbi:MAG: helix-turn-helix domain-containing protein [Lachnospiraceae bacterium]|nr:helix-turn-helix domain-containing protein [Lachnospiraceae bacterium]